MRDHWAIENALHWQLDVSFREDAARNRKDNGPGNIAVLRRRALDVVRRDTSKGSLSIKLKKAGWDEEFLCSVLVIPPFLTGCGCRTYAAIFSFCAGVIPPMPIFGRSLL